MVLGDGSARPALIRRLADLGVEADTYVPGVARTARTERPRRERESSFQRRRGAVVFLAGALEPASYLNDTLTFAR